MPLLKSLADFFDRGRGVDELARRLACSPAELAACPVQYASFTIPKKSGGERLIAAPAPQLKKMQRRLLRRVLARLKCHDAAMGFERGRSILTNASVHVGKAVVLRMDIKEFFPSTSRSRIRRYFRAIGWNRRATRQLLRLTTHQGGLPQGAPTSPRLANLVNNLLDRRLTGLASRHGAIYTRYADDLTLSFYADKRDETGMVIARTKRILADFGYRLHQKRKLQIRRQHERQVVTGLVVNEQPALPRPIRRRLRAIEHHMATRGESSLSAQQLAGWRALQKMIDSGH